MPAGFDLYSAAEFVPDGKILSERGFDEVVEHLRTGYRW